MAELYDQLLRQRMTEVGIRSWLALGQRAAVGRRVIRAVRQGQIEGLRWGELGAVAMALEWSVPELLRLLAAWAELAQGSDPHKAEVSTEVSSVEVDAADAFGAETFRMLQLLLTQYPTAAKLAQIKPDLPAQNLVALFRPLETLLASWGIQTIGEVWEPVGFDPLLHQADQSGLRPGDLVYIRYVGYRRGDEILCPAKVSQTLPAQCLV